jgi:hypothetical protein
MGFLKLLLTAWSYSMHLISIDGSIIASALKYVFLGLSAIVNLSDIIRICTGSVKPSWMARAEAKAYAVNNCKALCEKFCKNVEICYNIYNEVKQLANEKYYLRSSINNPMRLVHNINQGLKLAPVNNRLAVLWREWKNAESAVNEAWIALKPHPRFSIFEKAYQKDYLAIDQMRSSVSCNSTASQAIQPFKEAAAFTGSIVLPSALVLTAVATGMILGGEEPTKTHIIERDDNGNIIREYDN